MSLLRMSCVVCCCLWLWIVLCYGCVLCCVFKLHVDLFCVNGWNLVFFDFV